MAKRRKSGAARQPFTREDLLRAAAPDTFRQAVIYSGLEKVLGLATPLEAALEDRRLHLIPVPLVEADLERPFREILIDWTPGLREAISLLPSGTLRTKQDQFVDGLELYLGSCNREALQLMLQAVDELDQVARKIIREQLAVHQSIVEGKERPQLGG